MAAGAFGSLWVSLCSHLSHRPLLRSCLIGLLGGIVSDFIAQKSVGGVRGSRRYDYARTVRLVLYGLVIGTPIAFKWYQLLDKHVMADAPTSPTAVVVKMLCDQLVMCPIGTAMFLMGMRLMEGRPLSSAWRDMTSKIWSVLKANYMLWPAAHIINFALIPSTQRILYLNCVGVLWGAIMSRLAMERVEPAKAALAGQRASSTELKDLNGDVKDLRIKSC